MDGTKFFDFILLQVVSQLKRAKALLCVLIWSILTFHIALLEFPDWCGGITIRLWSCSALLCSLSSVRRAFFSGGPSPLSDIACQSLWEPQYSNQPFKDSVTSRTRSS